MLDRKILIEAIERSDSILPHIPAWNEYITFPGVLLCETPTDHPLANKAMMARLDADNVDATIARVQGYFKARNKSFGWIVGPGSTPSDLGRRLEARGFVEHLSADGLFLPEVHAEITANPDVKIQELPLDKLESAVGIMAVGFGIPEAASRYFLEMIRRSFPAVRMRSYIAYIDDIGHPVGCGYVAYYPDQPIALLCGGATLPDYRGRGIYKTMLAHRLADIRKDGVESVIVLADQKTSAPICRRHGFAKICELHFYVVKNV